MRKIRTAVLTAMATLAVAGVGLAAGRDVHMMKVDLPDGSVARIEYKGNVAPKVTFAPVAHAMPAGLLDAFGALSLSGLDRIAVEMDQQPLATIHEVTGFPATQSLVDGELDLTALEKLPPGVVHYEFVSTSDRRGTCDRSIVASYGPDQAPKMVSRSSGDCKSLGRVPTPVRVDPPAEPAVPDLTIAGMFTAADRSRAGTTV